MEKYRSTLLVAAVFAAFSGCTVGPNYVRPTAEVPAAYKEIKGWKVAEPRDTVIRGKWWEIYDAPLLNELEEKVSISNQNVVMAEAQFRQARAMVQVARSSYFPKVTAAPSYTRSRASLNAGSSNSSIGSGASAVTLSDYSLPVDAAWQADIWGQVRRTVESNLASAQSSAAVLESVRLTMQAEVATDYFQLRTVDAQKQLLDATVKDYSKSLELTKNRYASGVASRGDVVLAETQLKTTEAQAIDLGVQRAQLEHAIALLIGTPASTFSLPPTPLTLECLFNSICVEEKYRAVAPAIPVGIPSELLERRPDVASAERLVAAANAQIGVAEAAFYPTVTLSASGGFQSSSLSDWLNWPSRFWSIGAAVSELVFDGGLRRAQTDQAKAAYDANVASYRQTVLTAFQEVEDNLAALRILEAEGKVQNEAVKAAQESVTVTTNQYKAGTASYLDVIVVQTVALTGERTAITILGERMTAGVQLINALGGTWNASTLPSNDALESNDRLFW
jgi:NodT family efflux transporter outer membrane factor (OMF) lipoprotein